MFEDLTAIRERLADGKKFQQWAFKRFAEYVAYKAEAVGISVDQVPPQYTSQQCSHPDCGFTHEDNRNGDEFVCLTCGYELNADYNAAKNIGKRYVPRAHVSWRTGIPSVCPEVRDRDRHTPASRPMSARPGVH